MSFKFNFDLEDEDDEQAEQIPSLQTNHTEETTRENLAEGSQSVWDEKSHTVTLDELLETLPSRILYSPIPLPFPLSHPILRRDLHDARFQLASTSTLTYTSQLPDSTLSNETPQDSRSTEDGSVMGGESRDEREVKDQGESYVSAGAGTDLIPGLYEGGLKTWEGGLDLIEVLSTGMGEGDIGDWVKGSGALEVGCGTALPSAYILSRLLASSTSSSTESSAAKAIKPTRILCQDYNLPVLILVSLPNLLLAALPYLPITSLEPISGPFDSSEPSSGPNEEGNITSLRETDDKPDWTIPGELEITQSLKSAFKSLLSEQGINLEFRYGGWKGLSEEISSKGEGYGLIISAETIYAEGSVGDLISVLKAATESSTASTVLGNDEQEKEKKDGENLGMDGLSVRDPREDWGKTDLRNGGNVILIAAKVLYFGVGGGIHNFLNRVESEKGWWVGVKEWTRGVGRKVVRIGWEGR